MSISINHLRRTEVTSFQQEGSSLSQTIEDLFHRIHSNQIYTPYRHIPKERLYRLFIDANRWPAGIEQPTMFDRKEPGYMQAMMHAFMVIMEDRSDLNVGAIKHYHDMAVHDVRSDIDNRLLDKGLRRTILIGSYKTGEVQFGLFEDETLTQDGLAELYDRWKNEATTKNPEDDDFIRLSDMMENPKDTAQGKKPTIKLKRTHPGVLSNFINMYLIQYFNSILRASIDEEKIAAIVRLCQRLEQLHPFFDGNIRTFGILLLNKLLVMNGLSPTCLADPNCLDCMSTAQLVDQVREGQLIFKNLRA